MPIKIIEDFIEKLTDYYIDSATVENMYSADSNQLNNLKLYLEKMFLLKIV